VKTVANTWRGGEGGRQYQQWTQSLTDYAYPIIGQLPVAMVDKAHIIAVLKPIWETKTTTAERLRARIEVVLDFARGHSLRSGDNPASSKGNLDAVLPRPSKLRQVEHLAALPYADIPAFMAKLRAIDGIVARAAEFAILTASRVGEATGAGWDEIDLEGAVWTVPAGRMKAGREHRVPLSDRALEILKGLPRAEGVALVFPNRCRRGKCINGATARRSKTHQRRPCGDFTRLQKRVQRLVRRQDQLSARSCGGRARACRWRQH